MKQNIYDAIADKATVTRGFLRRVLDWEICEIECAETDEEFEDACAEARLAIDITISELKKAKDAISQLKRTDFE